MKKTIQVEVDVRHDVMIIDRSDPKAIVAVETGPEGRKWTREEDLLRGIGHRRDFALVNEQYFVDDMRLWGATLTQYAVYLKADGTLVGDGVPFLTEEHKKELRRIHARMVVAANIYPQMNKLFV